MVLSRHLIFGGKIAGIGENMLGVLGCAPSEVQGQRLGARPPEAESFSLRK